MLWLKGITGEKIKGSRCLPDQDLDWSVVMPQITYLCECYMKSIGSVTFSVSLLFPPVL